MEKKNEFCLQEIKGRKAVTCIETHTEGEPTRTILSGFPEIPGNTMEEKMLYMMQEQDWMRKAKLGNVRVFGSIDNLALFSHLKGMDPQYNFKGETDYSYTPNKTYSFGVEINF